MAGRRAAGSGRAGRSRAPAPDAAQPADGSALELGLAEVEALLEAPATRAAAGPLAGPLAGSLADPLADPLADALGVELAAELRRLQASAGDEATRARGDTVVLLPGILASQLAVRRDTIWIDLIDVARGRLKALGMAASGVTAPDIIGPAYLLLSLRLRLAGYRLIVHPFDWRRDIRELGRELAQRLAGVGPVHLVAHSMGGLVARAALRAGGFEARRLVTMGTPHRGSFSTTRAFDGTHGIVNALARVARVKPDSLAAIFCEFPGLAQMIPDPAVIHCPDFANPAAWPAGRPRPADPVLKAMADFRGLWDEKFPSVEISTIVGSGHATDTAAAVAGGAIVYEPGDGDGTVPLAAAQIPHGNFTWFARAEHAAMPNNATVVAAVLDILAGRRPSLASTVPPPRLVTRAERAAAEPALAEGLGDAALVEAGMRSFVAPPDPAELRGSAPPPAAGAPGPCDDDRLGPSSAAMVVGRGRALRLELRLATGNILDADANCYCLGLFREVDPTGAAGAIDEAMDGAISMMRRHRMLSAGVGEVTVLPNGRHPIRAQAIAFVGLGDFAGFVPETMEAVGNSMLRTFLAARMDEVAMVPFGASSGVWNEASFRFLMKGFLTALDEAGPNARFRTLTICDRNPERLREVRAWMHALAGTRLCDPVELSMDELSLPERYATRGRAGAARVPRFYLFVSEEQRPADPGERPPLSTALLPPGGGAERDTAAIPQERQPGSVADVERLLATLGKAAESAAFVTGFGESLATLVLGAPVRAAIARRPDAHLVVIHGARASHLPWETLVVGGQVPALSGGISHRYKAHDLSVAKWPASRPAHGPVRVLLVADPTGDLDGARREQRRILELARRTGGLLQVESQEGAAATRDWLLTTMAQGRHDVLHYAGHAFFDPGNRARSGLLLAGEQVLTGADVAQLGVLPPLILFNACEAARVRRGAAPPPARAQKVDERAGLAEALLRGGAANFIGTFWEVDDEAAMLFAETFYSAVAAHATLNEALLKGRRALNDRSLPDWANYIFYGDPDFVLVEGPADGR